MVRSTPGRWFSHLKCSVCTAITGRPYFSVSAAATASKSSPMTSTTQVVTKNTACGWYSSIISANAASTFFAQPNVTSCPSRATDTQRPCRPPKFSACTLKCLV